MTRGPADPSLSKPLLKSFSAAQRRAIVLLLGVFLASLAIGLWRNPATVNDPLVGDGPLKDQLVDRLDPNTATASELSVLPSMGPAKAQEIVAYRERIRSHDPNRIVFTKPDDLMRVKGIGYSLAKLAEPYLTFPTTAPAAGH